MAERSLLNVEQREKIIRRIQLLDENSKAGWALLKFRYCAVRKLLISSQRKRIDIEDAKQKKAHWSDQYDA